jgi:hypothetical protein
MPLNPIMSPPDNIDVIFIDKNLLINIHILHTKRIRWLVSGEERNRSSIFITLDVKLRFSVIN